MRHTSQPTLAIPWRDGELENSIEHLQELVNEKFTGVFGG